MVKGLGVEETVESLVCFESRKNVSLLREAYSDAYDALPADEFTRITTNAVPAWNRVRG
jgi:hypothetical protein